MHLLRAAMAGARGVKIATETAPHYFTLTDKAVADITVIDPESRFVFDAAANHSKSANFPFLGWQLQGRAIRTYLARRLAWLLQDC